MNLKKPCPNVSNEVVSHKMYAPFNQPLTQLLNKMKLKVFPIFLSFTYAFSFAIQPCAFAQPEQFVNSLGITFSRIPAGTFVMGRTESLGTLRKDFPQFEDSRFTQFDDELPAHKVTISRSYFLSKYEVTVGQFKAFLKESGYVPESIRDKTGGYGYNKDYDPSKTEKGDAFEGRDPKYSWENPGFVQTDDHPVTNVTWNDAVFLAQWLSKKEGKKYRLPTEAEWEYACLAGSQTRFGVGDDPDAVSAYANLFDQTTAKNWPKWQNFAQKQADGFPFTAPVGSFKPNKYGLYDMSGNVWEWVSDFYSSPYVPDAVIDPIGPARGELQIRRGGSWHTWALYSRCQFRNWNTAETRYTLVGIRLLLETHETKD